MAHRRLGQHWLTDEQALAEIVACADLTANDHVLEIGPGRGHLTDYLLKTEATIIALEYDPQLADQLTAKYSQPQIVIQTGDIRQYDFADLPIDYKICANIPYYLKAYLLRQLIDTSNKPRQVVLLVQQEVAQRLANDQRQSLLAILAKADYRLSLGPTVSADKFKPAPRVDSQVLKLDRQPAQIEPELWACFSRLVKFGFASPRKQLYHNLASGLKLSKAATKSWLTEQGLDFKQRAETLSLADWRRLALSQPTSGI